MSAIQIRQAAAGDAGELLSIYRPIVEETATSFETECPSEAAFANRIAKACETHAWLVAEIGGELAGYAYATPHRPRSAYQYSVETSVYTHAGFRKRGIGSRLYERLFDVLGELPYFHAFAGITLPNAGSVALHQSVGFSSIGAFPNVGYKLGAWHDVSWWYRKIKDGEPG